MNDVLTKNAINKNTPDSKKWQVTVSLPTSTLNKIKSIQELQGGNQSRNKVIENAVDFYFSYVTNELNQDYLCSVLGQKIEGMINQASDRIGRLQFKEAVELNVLTRAVASLVELDKDSYDKMRGKAVIDVKSTKGIISVYEAQE